MKKTILLTFLLMPFAAAIALQPQTDTDRQDLIKKLDAIYDVDELPKRYSNYRTEYVQSYQEPFEDVFNTVVDALADFSCRTVVSKQSMDDDGFFKGVIKSDYCVFVRNVDGIMDSLEHYSVKVPFIRGGIWENGRMKYTFILREDEDGSTSVEIRGEISGLESNITNTIHFWESNGNFETAFLKSVEVMLAG